MPPEADTNGQRQSYGRNEPAVSSLLNARLVDRMFYHDINAFFSHECTYGLMMGATEFFLFKCLALGPRYHHLLPRQANWLPTCHGDQTSWGVIHAYQGPLQHHNTLRKNRMLWKEIVESRWDHGPLRPGYLKFIGRFRNIKIVCFIGHVPEAEEALITILDGISAKPAWRNWEPPRLPRVHFTFHHYVGYHCSYLCPECEAICSTYKHRMQGSERPSPDIHCTSVGMGRESWFSTCAGCVHCLGSTESIRLLSANYDAQLLSWEPGLRHPGPSAYNMVYKSTRVTAVETLIHPYVELWDDPFRAAMLRISPHHNLDPDAVKEPFQPIYGKEGLADAYKMWIKWGNGGCDRVTFAQYHQRLGFYWSRAFPDTTRLQFSSKTVYSDPLVPGKKHKVNVTRQIIGRHNFTHLLRGQDEEQDSTKSSEENSDEDLP